MTDILLFGTISDTKGLESIMKTRADKVVCLGNLVSPDAVFDLKYDKWSEAIEEVNKEIQEKQKRISVLQTKVLSFGETDDVDREIRSLAEDVDELCKQRRNIEETADRSKWELQHLLDNSIGCIRKMTVAVKKNQSRFIYLMGGAEKMLLDDYRLLQEGSVSGNLNSHYLACLDSISPDLMKSLEALPVQRHLSFARGFSSLPFGPRTDYDNHYDALAMQDTEGKKDTELSDGQLLLKYGKQVFEQLKRIDKNDPYLEVFFTGEPVTAPTFWKLYSHRTAYAFVEKSSITGAKPFKLKDHTPPILVCPGPADEGYYCIYRTNDSEILLCNSPQLRKTSQTSKLIEPS